MDDVLTPERLAARYEGITESTLAEWRYKGTGPAFFRAGKRVYYREADVLAWEKEQAAEQIAKRAS